MELKEGMRAPDFTLQDSQGNHVTLSNFKGKNSKRPRRLEMEYLQGNDRR